MRLGRTREAHRHRNPLGARRRYLRCGILRYGMSPFHSYHPSSGLATGRQTPFRACPSTPPRARPPVERAGPCRAGGRHAGVRCRLNWAVYKGCPIRRAWADGDRTRVCSTGAGVQVGGRLNVGVDDRRGHGPPLAERTRTRRGVSRVVPCGRRIGARPGLSTPGRGGRGGAAVRRGSHPRTAWPLQAANESGCQGGRIGARTLRDQVSITTDTSPDTIFADHGDSGSVLVAEHGFVGGYSSPAQGRTRSAIRSPPYFRSERLHVHGRGGGPPLTTYVVGHGYGCGMSSDEADCSWSARHSSPS